MRKGQEKIIQKARKCGMSEKAICYLSNETMPLWKLEACYPYFRRHKNLDDFGIIDEIMDFMIGQRYTRGHISSLFYCRFFNGIESEIKQIFESDSTIEEKHEIFRVIISFCVTYDRATAILLKNISTDLSYYWDNTRISNDAEFDLLIDYLQFWSDNHMLDDLESCYKLDKYLKYVMKYHITLQDSIESGFSYTGYVWLMVKRHCKTIYDLFRSNDNSNDDFYQSTVYYDSDLEKQIMDTAKKLPEKTTICVNEKAQVIEMYVSPTAIRMVFSKYKQLLYVSGSDHLKPSSKNYSIEILYFYDNEALYVKNNKKNTFYPLNIKVMAECDRAFDQKFFMIMNGILQRMIDQGSYVVKDLIGYVFNGKLPIAAIPPVTIVECMGKGNLNQLLHEKYKKSQHINWNKTDLCKGYLTMKMLPVITEDSANRLATYLYLKDLSVLPNDANTNLLCRVILVDCIYTALDKKSYWKNEDGEHANEKDVKHVVEDYIDLCHRTKTKINLKHKSAKKLKEEHDNLFYEYTKKDVPLIQIPRNTKFKALDRMLPIGFEKIKSRKRIILEGMNMHHCVALYAQKINRDKCAIYSLVYKDRRYTIEFGMTGRELVKYEIRQIQSMCNRGCSKEVWEYVESFINVRDGNC
ncbi:MAG: hypothetical protein HDR21_13400 [Lachnospiraceae bacterium]|nr:hypothetical protein [Lachnospiraceae bacterium]